MSDEINSKISMGLVFVFVMLAAEGRFAQPGKPMDEATFDQTAAWLSSDYRERLKERDSAKSHFDESAMKEWQRSVVSIGRHDPRIDVYNWIPHRTGFAVNNGMCRVTGQLIVSGDIYSFAGAPNFFRVHADPLWMPQPSYAHPATVVRTGGLSSVRTLVATSITPAAIANWTSASYEVRFPVVLIGFVDGELTRFFTHSIGPSDSEGRIRLSARPPTGFGGIFGAPVFNTDGLVVGVYSPLDNKPTYITAVELRKFLR